MSLKPAPASLRELPRAPPGRSPAPGGYGLPPAPGGYGLPPPPASRAAGSARPCPPRRCRPGPPAPDRPHPAPPPSLQTPRAHRVHAPPRQVQDHPAHDGRGAPRLRVFRSKDDPPPSAPRGPPRVVHASRRSAPPPAPPPTRKLRRRTTQNPIPTPSATPIAPSSSDVSRTRRRGFASREFERSATCDRCAWWRTRREIPGGTPSSSSRARTTSRRRIGPRTGEGSRARACWWTRAGSHGSRLAPAETRRRNGRSTGSERPRRGPRSTRAREATTMIVVGVEGDRGGGGGYDRGRDTEATATRRSPRRLRRPRSRPRLRRPRSPRRLR